MDILPNLRNENDKDLDIQCDVFEEFKHEDDEEMAATFSGSVDIGNHRQLFDVILSKVGSMVIEETEEGKGVGEGGVEKKHKEKNYKNSRFLAYLTIKWKDCQLRLELQVYIIISLII